MADSEIEVLNDYGAGSLERRRTIGKNGPGKARYTITVRSEPILVETSPKALGVGPAQAIAQHLRDKISSIPATASKSTMRSRLSAQAALIRGEPWAQKRYSGGRIGTRAPARSDKLFNDSGRLIESIAVAARGTSYLINVAGNRFDPSTFNGGEGALAEMIARLRTYVPELGDARALLDSLPVRRALQDGLAAMLQKANERTVELKKQLMAQTVGRLLRMVA